VRKKVDDEIFKQAEVVAQALNQAAPRGTSSGRQPLNRSHIAAKRLQGRKGTRHPAKKGVTYVASESGLAHLVEFGTVERVQSKTGRATGRMPPNPYFTRTWFAKKPAMTKNVIAAAGRAIDQALKK